MGSAPSAGFVILPSARMSDDREPQATYELHGTTANAPTWRVGPIASAAAASALGERALAEGRTSRVALYQNRRDVLRLLGVIGRLLPVPLALGDAADDD
jgi:hypothetical protein